MIDLEDYVFADKYGLNPDDFMEIAVASLPVSIRAINRFLANGIPTLGDLLKAKPSQLLQFSGFGRTTLNEIEQYFSTLQLDYRPSPYGTAVPKTNTNIPIFFKAHAEEIAIGDFSFAEGLSLSDFEQEDLDRYKKAYDLLGEELVLDCTCRPKQVEPLIKLFSEFAEQSKLSFEISQLIDSIPSHRKQKLAIGFIHAFTSRDDERAVLLAQYNANAALSEIRRDNLLSIDKQSYRAIKAFLKWCQFDIEKELLDLYTSTLYSDRMVDVVKGRAEKKTLEEIGAKYGITRERIRQIEAKAKRRFARMYAKTKLLPKISAEYDGEPVILPSVLSRYCKEKTPEIVFLLKSNESASYTYDSQLDVFIVGDDSLMGRVTALLETLPDIITVQKANEIIESAQEDDEIPEEMMRRALLDAYQVTGGLYHRSRLSLGAIYEKIIKKYYPDGILAYDPDQIQDFRRHVMEDYGDVGLPENDRALTARIAGICVLCGRGMYTVKKKKYISDDLKERIYRYIKDSKNQIFMTNTLFSVFEDDLATFGITNKYYLQGVLHELFGDEFYFRRDYVSKDPSMTSMYASIEDYIYNSDYPVSKQQIQREFPGVSEIVIMLAVGAPYILNYFGQYLHAKKLKLSSLEIERLRSHLNALLSDKVEHGSGEVFESLLPTFKNTFSRNGVFYPFSAFSLLQYLFSSDYQFSRPYIALKNVEIGKPGERLHEFVYNSDEIAVADLFDFVRESKIYVQSMLEYINSCNDQYIFADEDNVIRIELTGVDQEIAAQVEKLVLSEINETIPIRDLLIWNDLPTINIPWSDWLVYSVLKKWGNHVDVSTSSGQLRYAVPLVSPLGKMVASEFKDLKKDHSITYQCDNLDDIDSLLIDLIDDDPVEDL